MFVNVIIVVRINVVLKLLIWKEFLIKKVVILSIIVFIIKVKSLSVKILIGNVKRSKIGLISIFRIVNIKFVSSVVVNLFIWKFVKNFDKVMKSIELIIMFII